MTDFTCPKCGTVGMLVIDHSKGERVKMRIEPGPKSYINTKTAGGVLENLGKLMESIAKDAGLRAEAILRGVTMDDAGVLTYEVEMVPLVAQDVRPPEAQGDDGDV